MANPIANSLCKICKAASDSLNDLDKLMSRNSDFDKMPEFRYLRDAMEEILTESYMLKESIGYRVDEWFLDYLRK